MTSLTHLTANSQAIQSFFMAFQSSPLWQKISSWYCWITGNSQTIQSSFIAQQPLKVPHTNKKPTLALAFIILQLHFYSLPIPTKQHTSSLSLHDISFNWCFFMAVQYLPISHAFLHYKILLYFTGTSWLDYSPFSQLLLVLALEICHSGGCGWMVSLLACHTEDRGSFLSGERKQRHERLN